LFIEFNSYYEPWLDKINGCAEKGAFYCLEKLINNKRDGRNSTKKLKSELAELMGCSIECSQSLIEEIQRI
jgi:hypothetical protein